MRRARIALTIVLVFAFAVCGLDWATSEVQAAEKIQIKFLHKWPQPEYKPYFDEVIAAFEAENGNIDIVDEAVADEPIKDKLRILMGSNSQPDIFFSWCGEFANKFIRANAVLDITPYLDENGGEWRKSIMKAGLEPFSLGGKDYGIPLRINCKYFVYNKEIFAKYNLAPPETWDQLMAVCETLKKNGVTPIAFGDQIPWAACHYITGLNQKLVPDDVRKKDYNFKIGEFTDPGYVKALEMFKELNDKGYFNEFVNSTPHNIAQQSWVAGVAAMHFLELEEFVTISQEFDPAGWGFFPMPEITSGSGIKNYIIGAPDGFMVSANTQHPKEAIAFLKYLVNDKNAAKIVKQLGWPSPVIGAVNADTAPDYLVAGMTRMEEADGMALWLDTDIHIKISDVYLPGFQEIIEGITTPQELMKKIQEVAKVVQSLNE
jgi:raffinose/stachyose/melibiose transport system substrate-binding protein